MKQEFRVTIHCRKRSQLREAAVDVYVGARTKQKMQLNFLPKHKSSWSRYEKHVRLWSVSHMTDITLPVASFRFPHLSCLSHENKKHVGIISPNLQFRWRPSLGAVVFRWVLKRWEFHADDAMWIERTVLREKRGWGETKASSLFMWEHTPKATSGFFKKLGRTFCRTQPCGHLIFA